MAKPACLNLGCEWFECPPTALCEREAWCVTPNDADCGWKKTSEGCEEANCEWYECGPTERCVEPVFCRAPRP